MAPQPRMFEVGRDVTLRKGAPYCCGSANPDRAGREIDRVRIFGPARIALKAAVGP